MVNKVGVLIDSLESTDKLIYLGHQATLASVDYDIFIFYLNISKMSLQAPVAFMESSECFNFDGVAIATCLNTAATLTRCPGPSKKLFYVWDLEWINRTYPASLLETLYQNPEIDLVARNDRDHKILSRQWKTPVMTVNNFDFGWKNEVSQT